MTRSGTVSARVPSTWFSCWVRAQRRRPAVLSVSTPASLIWAISRRRIRVLPGLWSPRAFILPARLPRPELPSCLLFCATASPGRAALGTFRAVCAEPEPVGARLTGAPRPVAVSVKRLRALGRGGKSFLFTTFGYAQAAFFAQKKLWALMPLCTITPLLSGAGPDFSVIWSLTRPNLLAF